MCYGNCFFKNFIGECTITDFKKIEELTGQSACYIGGADIDIHCKEEEKMWNEDLENGNIDKWIKIIRDNKLEWDSSII